MSEIFSQEGREQIRINELHPSFTIQIGTWMFNHLWDSKTQGTIDRKMRAGFDDISLLDQIHYSAKIGINTDPAIPCKFVLFVYGTKNEDSSIRELAKNFPYSEIISNTSSTGVKTERSLVKVVNS